MPNDDDALSYYHDAMPYDDYAVPHNHDPMSYNDDAMPHDNDAMPHNDYAMPNDDDAVPHDDDTLRYNNNAMRHDNCRSMRHDCPVRCKYAVEGPCDTTTPCPTTTTPCATTTTPCATTTTPSAPAEETIDFVGTFTDGSGTHTIGEQTWEHAYEGSMPSVFNFVSVNNDAFFAIAQNAADNAFNPSLYSRFDWLWTSTGLFYCQSAFDAASQEAAEAVMRPDDSAPETSGCGGMFPWSKLTPVQANALVGDYTDANDGVHAITPNAWAQTYGDATSHFVFTQVLAGMNDTSGRLVARNADSNAFSAGMWSAFDWVQRDGDYWYCQSKYDGAK